jgi:hypothetical protein
VNIFHQACPHGVVEHAQNNFIQMFCLANRMLMILTLPYGTLSSQYGVNLLGGVAFQAVHQIRQPIGFQLSHAMQMVRQNKLPRRKQRDIRTKPTAGLHAAYGTCFPVS